VKSALPPAKQKLPQVLTSSHYFQLMSDHNRSRPSLLDGRPSERIDDFATASSIDEANLSACVNSAFLLAFSWARH